MEGRLSTTLAAKGCMLSTQQERNFIWIDPSEWWRREKWWTSRESLRLPVIGTWGYPIWAYTPKEAMSVMFPIYMAPRPQFSISEEFLHSIILRPKKPLFSWNLVNPLLSMNEAWMDKCAARLRPLADQYKPRQHQSCTLKKFWDLSITTQSCSGDKKSHLKDIYTHIMKSRSVFKNELKYIYRNQKFILFFKREKKFRTMYGPDGRFVS